MVLDVLPYARAVHVPIGGIAVVDLYFRDENNDPILKSSVSDWDFKVFTDQGASPETAIYTELANAATISNSPDGTDVMQTTVAQTAECRLPIGATMIHKFDPSNVFAAASGQNYRLEYTLRYGAHNLPIVASVALVIDAAYS
jgi:hypothetical protein